MTRESEQCVRSTETKQACLPAGQAYHQLAMATLKKNCGSARPITANPQGSCPVERRGELRQLTSVLGDVDPHQRSTSGPFTWKGQQMYFMVCRRMFVGIKRIDFTRNPADGWPTEKRRSIALHNLSRRDVDIDGTKKPPKVGRERRESNAHHNNRRRRHRVHHVVHHRRKDTLLRWAERAIS